mgnify:CR=1 FL=1
MYKRQDVARECSSGYYEYAGGIRARYIRVTGGAIPYGQTLRVSGLRVFGNVEGDRPAQADAKAVRVDALDGKISWQHIENAQGCNVRYGITPDMESARPWPDGYIVRELSRMPSNFRCQGSIQDFLTKHDIPGIAGIDTRALTKILREKGTMNGMITTNENYNLDEILPKLKEYTTGNVVDKVTCSEKNVLKGSGKKVALMDFGAKNNIAKSLNARGCEVTIYPAHTSAEEILGANPDGIMLSNGPGDPKECTAIIEELKKLYASDVPIFAICLGHQLMALANGADTHKMKYGHRGGNHPVKDLSTCLLYTSDAADE